MAGGAVKTGEYTLPGYRHDWAAMNLSLFAGSPFFKAYGAELTRHGCAFVPVNRPFASSFPDGTWAGVSTDMAETVAAIRALSPPDAATWEDPVRGFGDEAPHLFGLLGSADEVSCACIFHVQNTSRQGGGRHAGHGPVPAVLAPRLADRNLREPAGPRDAGRLGHAPRFRPRRRGRGDVSLSGGHGRPGLRHGDRPGRGRYDDTALVAAITARGGVVETGASVARILHRGRPRHRGRTCGWPQHHRAACRDRRAWRPARCRG